LSFIVMFFFGELFYELWKRDVIIINRFELITIFCFTFLFFFVYALLTFQFEFFEKLIGSNYWWKSNQIEKLAMVPIELYLEPFYLNFFRPPYYTFFLKIFSITGLFLGILYPLSDFKYIR
jgi:hypothetical protein